MPQTSVEIEWQREILFDITAEPVDIDISIHDKYGGPRSIGNITIYRETKDLVGVIESYQLENRGSEEIPVTGSISLSFEFQNTTRTRYGYDDFQFLKARNRNTQRNYAIEVIPRNIIASESSPQTGRLESELQQLKLLSSPYVNTWKFYFHTPSDHYLVTNFKSGGELLWHLQEGRFQEDRSRFYAAELLCALKSYHDHDIIFKDLRPQKILLDAKGHIALSPYSLRTHGIAKATDGSKDDICAHSTIEYLAPEAILEPDGYSKASDFWALGVIIFEIACGWSPFFAENIQQMYKNIAFGKIRFPRDGLSSEGRSFVKALLNRNLNRRLGAKHGVQDLMAHPWFATIDWERFEKKLIEPPFRPKLKSDNVSNNDPKVPEEPWNAPNLNQPAVMRGYPSSAQYSIDSGIGLSSRFSSIRSTPFSYDSALGMPSTLESQFGGLDAMYEEWDEEEKDEWDETLFGD
ncbi:MAG: hypothetical protein Q9187_000737 [Circinaria calcarea]